MCVCVLQEKRVSLSMPIFQSRFYGDPNPTQALFTVYQNESGDCFCLWFFFPYKKRKHVEKKDPWLASQKTVATSRMCTVTGPTSYLDQSQKDFIWPTPIDITSENSRLGERLEIIER